MKEEEWKETNWLDNIKPVKNLPFEDGLFIDFYKSILFRNINTYPVKNADDLVISTQLTNRVINQIIPKAIKTAFYIHTEQVDVQDVLSNVDVEYDKEKSYYFLYVVCMELNRRDNPIAFTVSTKVKSYEFIEPYKSVFYDFDCKMAWDFLLSYFSQEKFTKNQFSIMWFRYRKILIKCTAKEYEAFVYNLYLKDVKNKTGFTRSRPEKDSYTTILQRAERKYHNPEIFDEV